MQTLLVTGATGNVGLEVISALNAVPHSYTVVAGVRNPEKDAALFSDRRVSLRAFDFADASTHAAALHGVDALFLLRPPQLADVKRYFQPLIAAAVAAGVRHVIFLSVQGAQNNRFIPHYKIEALIRQSGMDFTFLRPAYFMQNFITILRDDIVQRRCIFLPAGKARFALIDVGDVGSVTAQIVGNLSQHRNKAYDLTANEKLTFGEMAGIIGKATGRPVRYESPHLLRFYLRKRKEGVPPAFIFVMIMLHYLPRFQKEPPLSAWVQTLTGRPPVSFAGFVRRHTNRLQ